MELIRGFHNLQPRHRGCAATIGNFDGVHLGHQAVLGQLSERAAELGMTQSTFANASGWPDPRHRMSMQDLGLLAVRLITEFPDYRLLDGAYYLLGYCLGEQGEQDGRRQDQLDRRPSRVLCRRGRRTGPSSRR